MRIIRGFIFTIVLVIQIFDFLIIGPITRLFSLKAVQRLVWYKVFLQVSLLVKRLTIIGKERYPSTPAVYVVTHVSKADPFISILAVPEIKRFVLSYAVFKYNFLIGIYAWLVGNIFVKSGRGQTVSAAVAALNHSNVIIYPEGDILPKIGRFRSGYKVISTQANVPVVPVVIIGAVRNIIPMIGREVIVEIGHPQPPGTDVRDIMIEMVMAHTGKTRDEVSDDALQG